VARTKYEVPVLSNDAIESQLAGLRAGQEELREDVRELRGDSKSFREKLGVVQTELSRDIKALDEKLDKKIGEVTAKVESVDERLSAKIDGVNEKIMQLSNAVAGMRGLQKATLWMMGVLGSLGTVGKFLHWF
jgi:predicted nuclease with TOPRIM domain